MKVLVFGSTGATGKQIVKQALELGHQVTAFARKPSDVIIKHKNLTIVKGDILKYDTVEKAVQSHDAVISALGIRTLKKNSIMSDGTRNIIDAMQKQNVKRFICISSIGVGNSKEQQSGLGFLYNHILIPYMMQNLFGDKEVQEKYTQESKLDWTIVRPAILTNGIKTGEYRTFTYSDKNIKPKISRAVVADFILKQLTDINFINKCVSISY